jgi:hypothetical protein
MECVEEVQSCREVVLSETSCSIQLAESCRKKGEEDKKGGESCLIPQ